MNFGGNSFGMSLDVVGIGEVLIDFVGTEPGSYMNVPAFKKCFGGAPMNTLVGVARLGWKSGAITAVGEDPFGKFLIRELQRNGVDTSQVKIKKGMRTTISFVANEPETGERSFIFYRKPWVTGTADSSLSMEDINLNYISNAKILHVSGFSFSQNPSRKTIFSAVKYARSSGVHVSFDPTLRLDVWNSTRTIRRIYGKMLRLSDIATFSQEEASFIFGTQDPEKAARKAFRYGVETVGIKMGAEGAFLQRRTGEKARLPAFKVRAVDTTGAGDGWNAGLLVGLISGWDLHTCLTVANAVGALVVMKHGAITALPYKHELEEFLKANEIDVKL
ncbi:TPA: sugar kinase [Candidatus Bathyarchaeota archaeon]|nr:sugar kinase [Candidatus Bathyarchaeota archaeon]